MAYIYKITNNINGKIYIGKTEFSVEKRFREHCLDYKKERFEKRPLYSAMNKYGIENFSVETIEETDNPEEREKYWIEYFGSFKNGYNATLGGDGKRYLDYDLVEKVYNETKSVKETSALLNIDSSHVSDILKSKGYNPTRVRAEMSQKPVAKIDLKTDEILEVYSSIQEAEDKNNTNRHINKVCKGVRKSAGGYGWKYI